MPKWTDEQKLAIDVRDSNVLVAAAAGAGKTAVLVERIIGRVTDEKNPVDIDKLLIVTFTNAAAAEMRERIGASLSKKLEDEPENKRLQSQITLLNKASITTIHSFCLEVIRSNFHAIDLDPTFRIGDDTEALLLKNETLEELFDEKYEENSEEFLNLVECYGGRRDDSGLKDMVLSLYEFSQSTPEPKEWLRKMADMLSIGEDFDFNNTPWSSILKESIKVELTGLIAMMESAVNMADDPNLEPYKSHFEGEVMKLNNLLSCCQGSWDSLYSGFSSMGFEKLPRCKKEADKTVQEVMKNIRDGVKKRIDTIKEDVLIGDSNTIENEIRKLHPLIKSLTGLVMEFEDRFRQKKKEKGIIDFNDIEHYCIQILLNKDEDGNISPSRAALRYREKFEEIFIDEYQDSNLVQELILTTISRIQESKPNMFMVGDVKQSIYRFRQAKPEIFLHKYNTYKDEGPERRILLYKNFRSRKEVIDASNYIFKAIMSKNIGEIEYDDNEALNVGADYPPPKDKSINHGGPVEFHLIETQKVEEDTEEEKGAEEEEDLDSVQLEARMVGERILELVNGEGGMFVFDPKYENPSMPDELKTPEAKEDPEKEREILGYKYRKLEYRDIVILMRATSNTAPVYLEELKNMGIPVFADTGSGYFEQLEVKVMLSLLQIIDNPMQDIPLLSVLRSPIGSFKDDELADIRMRDNGENFYRALKAKGEDGDDLGLKVKGFLERLYIWRKKSLHMAISEFIWYLYMDTGYFAYCGAMPGGVQRQANLRVLFERARQYEETSFKGLFNFINFINKLRKGSGDMGSAKTLGENENVVRVMSIHKSKGLEFPVVFVCGMGRKFNLSDLKNSILFHHELGLGPDFVDSKRRITYPTIIKQALKRKIKLESFSEEMRILYVAFTRAKERLIITGTVGDVEKACKRWAVSGEGIKVPEYKIMGGGTFLDWIGPALIRHRDCRGLRTLAGMDEAHIIDDESKWVIKTWKRGEIIKDGVNVKEELGEEIGVLKEELQDSPYAQEVSRRLDYKYPFIKASNMPTKLSVTELKRRLGTALDDEYTQKIFIPTLLDTPSFMRGETKISPMEKGTIMHLVMQHIDFKKDYTMEDLKGLLAKMVEEEFLTQEEASIVDKGRIIKFLQSPLRERIREAKGVYREVPFFTEIKCSEVYKDFEDDLDDTILLQGIIDCYFEEDDGLVLIDYKTDYYEDIEEMKEKYGVQLNYYAMALERITGKAVKEKYLYLFGRGETLRLE